jgi:molybdopterin converting factor small subunit
MRITFKLHASLSDYLPAESRGKLNAVEIDVPEETTLDSLIERYRLPRKSVHLVLINGVFLAPADRPAARFADGDTIAIWPPIAGG